jgi:hypothetical protein
VGDQGAGGGALVRAVVATAASGALVRRGLFGSVSPVLASLLKGD